MVFFGLALFELLILSALLVFWVIGATVDRAGSSITAKWWAIVAFAIAAVAYIVMKPDVSFRDLLSIDFAMFAVKYLAVGVAYSFIEMFFNLRRSAEKFGEHWHEFSATKQAFNVLVDEKIQRFEGTYSDMIAALGRGELNKREVSDRLERFCSHVTSKYGVVAVVDASVNEYDLQRPEVKVNRKRLTSFMTVWVLMWPAYLVSLVLGDLLYNVFKMIADVVVKATQKSVDRLFSAAFDKAS